MEALTNRRFQVLRERSVQLGSTMEARYRAVGSNYGQGTEAQEAELASLWAVTLISRPTEPRRRSDTSSRRERPSGRTRTDRSPAPGAIRMKASAPPIQRRGSPGMVHAFNTRPAGSRCYWNVLWENSRCRLRQPRSTMGTPSALPQALVRVASAGWSFHGRLTRCSGLQRLVHRQLHVVLAASHRRRAVLLAPVKLSSREVGLCA